VELVLRVNVVEVGGVMPPDETSRRQGKWLTGV
jgi:hypothetical protein